jgi:hypothetical protein
MHFYSAAYLDTLLPLSACTDPAAAACALDRLADLALFHGRTLYAEHLARRAAAVREARP